MIRVANIAQMFEAGQQSSQENRKRKTLRDFLQPALGGDQAAMGKVFGADPDAGFKVQQHVAGQQKAQQEAIEAQLKQTSTMMVSSPQMAAQVYPQWKQMVEQVTGMKLPDQYEEGALGAARAFAGMKAPEAYTLSPGAKRFGPDNQVVAEVPFAPQKPEIMKADDGSLWAVTPDGYRPVGPGGQPQMAGPSGGAAQVLGDAFQGAVVDPVADFPQLINGFDNAQVSSLHRTPERNAQVGGVANSFHTKGQAMDLTGLTPQQVAELRQRSGGRYDVLDEGDHVHVEPARGVQARSSFGAGAPTFGRKPPKSEERYQTLSPQEIAQLGLPSGTVAQRSPSGQIQVVNKPLDRGAGQTVVTNPDGSTTVIPAGNPTEGERKSATLLKRMEGSLSQLQAALKEDPDAASPSVMASIAGSLPFVGNVARNNVNSSERQRVEAAQLDILDAALTLGTGAAYTREQIEGYRSAYFPQIGDTEATIKDKQARLNNVIQAARTAAGRALPRQPQQGARPSQPAANPAADKFAGFKVLD